MSSWSVRGIHGVGDLPACAEKFAGRDLLIVGGAACVWDDIRAFLPGFVNDWSNVARYGYDRKGVGHPSLPRPLDVMCVNSIIIDLALPVVHLASVHHSGVLHWVGLRRMHALGGFPATHSIAADLGVDCTWTFSARKGGSSSLFAVRVGLCLGYERVILAGIPFDNSGWFNRPPYEASHFAANVRDWLDLRENPEARARVRSLSGNTRKWWGGPGVL